MIEDIISSMNEKLGDDKDLIADDIVNLINYDNSNLDNITNLNNEINSLKERNNTLSQVNANLLKSVPLTTKNEKPILESEKEEKIISWKDCFDEKGNFKK